MHGKCEGSIPHFKLAESEASWNFNQLVVSAQEKGEDAGTRRKTCPNIVSSWKPENCSQIYLQLMCLSSPRLDIVQWLVISRCSLQETDGR